MCPSFRQKERCSHVLQKEKEKAKGKRFHVGLNKKQNFNKF